MFLYSLLQEHVTLESCAEHESTLQLSELNTLPVPESTKEHLISNSTCSDF